MKKQVTLKDIAKELGVSVATVSRALRGYPDIGEATKQAVKELAARWHYRPNTMAVGLRKQQSGIIGVLIPEVVHYFFSSVISGIMDEADAQQYAAMLFQTNESAEREQHGTNILLNARVEGLLVSLANDTSAIPHLQEAMEMGVPVVLFDKVHEDWQGSKVLIDDYTSAKEATTHLISQGCKRIAHISGHETARNAQERRRGYMDALRMAGMEIEASLIRSCHHVIHEEGYAFAKEFMAHPNPPDGLFTATDALAIGAMEAFKEAGWIIPQDIAVVGFSNWKMAEVVAPPLSSVHQPGYEMGKVAMQTLLEEIRSQQANRPIIYQTKILATQLIVRGSSRKTN